jgi:PAS domain S-box-containing protein
MEKSFISRIKTLFLGNTPYRITRSFALRMLPLSFLAGIFICIAIPVSYYYLERIDAGKRANTHANDIASFFRQVLEAHPLTWKEEVNSKLAVADIDCIRILDRNHNLIAHLTTCNVPEESWSLVKGEKEVTYGGDTYAVVRVGISLAEIERNTFMLLLFSLVCGTIEGIALFLLPVFKIQTVEDRVNEAHQILLNEQNKLKSSEEKFRTFFEFSPDGTLITTESGKILSVNQAFMEMFRLEEEDLSKINAANLYGDQSTREKLLSEIFEFGEIKNREVVFRKKDGSELPALISINLISALIMVGDESLKNEKVLLLNVIRDISEKKEVERQLTHAQKMESIGMLAGGVAHDFNNLLAGIMGYASLIKIQAPAENVFHEYAQIIEQSALRGSELTHKLLAFARGGKYMIENVNLNEIADEVLSILKHTIEKKIVIVKDLEPDLRFVKADASQINQVLLNLCVNARDAMTGAGKDEYRLTIRTFNIYLEKQSFAMGDVCPAGAYVGIEVSDTGTGVSPMILPRIFDPFFTTKEKGQGTGLGLSMVYGIIKNHDGYIDVKSEPTIGTSFAIYLPAVKSEVEDKDAATIGQLREEIDEVAGGSETILLIDDEKFIRDLGKIFLKNKGYKVLEAADGEEGIVVYQNNHDEIDLVLLDMIMPNKSGSEVYYELVKINPDVKVIIVSGFSLDNEARQLLQAGVISFIQKPYQSHKLLQVIREALD